ncbi:MAG: hypothetical protein A3J75_01855 [Acidobacteria bacterium RBG_16_68_9]|nr:MAG: hypothetical protein A3J75_01855 [Acidobacteria bacterium RBG_16_68_9]
MGLACSDSLLGPASVPNTVDTVTLYALSGTAISAPSAYSMLDVRSVRTDTTSQFDFAFDITAAGTPLLYSAGALGLSAEPGLQRSTKRFADVRTAPNEGYSADSLEMKIDSVFVARSRGSFAGCLFLGSVPRYGKFRVLAIDGTARSITLETLVNLNCGFRSLEEGIPKS